MTLGFHKLQSIIKILILPTIAIKSPFQISVVQPAQPQVNYLKSRGMSNTRVRDLITTLNVLYEWTFLSLVCARRQTHSQPDTILVFPIACPRSHVSFWIWTQLKKGHMSSLSESLFYFLEPLGRPALLNHAWFPLACCVKVFKLETLVIHIQ